MAWRGMLGLQADHLSILEWLQTHDVAQSTSYGELEGDIQERCVQP